MRSQPQLNATFALLVAAAVVAAQQKPRPIKWNNPDAPRSPGVEHKNFKSKSMDTEVGYCVYTPPGYADGKARFPVVYFLHGAGGNENSDAGGFSGLVARAVKDKKMPPVICVFPNGGMSGYADRPETKTMGETLIIKELIPHIDADYRTIASREGRVIAGFSMGGGGAVRLALKHPDMFSVAASWAGAFRKGGASPDDPVALAEKNIEQIKGKLRLLLVVGDKDLTYEGHKPVVDKLKDLGIAHEWIVLPGVDHNLGVYYQKTGEDFVRFLGKDLKPAEK